MLDLLDISKSYGDKNVLNYINYHFDKKDTIYSIIGDSGTGKTTLFNLLYGIDQNFEGDYKIDGISVKKFANKDWDFIRNKKISIVYQDYKLLENFTVYDNLKCAYFLDKKDRYTKIDQILELMNLEGISNLKVCKLSGGQKQRLAIARAIINNPQVLLLDEPTGNLDDDNTEAIMKYLSHIKKDCIIIVITHDHRITDYSDVVLELKNNKLNEIVNKKNTIVHFEKKQDSSKYVYSKPEFITFFMSSIRSRWGDLILNIIPICIIICIFICLFNMVNINYYDQLDLLYNGLSEETIYISSSNYTTEYMDSNKKQNITKMDDGERINFSSADLNNVKKITHIRDAELYNSATISLFDNDHSKLNYLIDEINYPDALIKAPSYSSAPKQISFVFNSMNIPYKFAEYYNKVPLLYGDYPRDNSNDIVIPDVVAYMYSNKIEECINTKISLETYNKEGDFKNKEYNIAGIYKTNYDKKVDESYPIYVNYIKSDFLDLFLTNDEYYNMKKSDFENNYLLKDYRNPIFETYENYVKAIGTNLGDLIIVVDDAENVKLVQDNLRELFPNLKMISQYEFKYGETSLAYKQTELYLRLGTLFASFILGIIIILLNKNYIKTRNKELAIIYSLGYSRTYAASLILFEYFLTFIVDIVLAYSVLKLLQISYFGNSTYFKLFDSIFNASQIFQVIGYIFIMILLSVIFSLFGINKKKLRKYLEGNK